MSNILDKTVTIIWVGQILLTTRNISAKTSCLILGDFGTPLISCLGLIR